MSSKDIVVDVESTDFFSKCLRELKKKMGDIEVTADTIITILRFSMEVVEATQLKGDAQKELCTKLVRQVVVEAPIADEKEKLLLDMIDNNILGNTVDLVVEATHGELDVNAATQVAATCCAAFLNSRRQK